MLQSLRRAFEFLTRPTLSLLDGFVSPQRVLVPALLDHPTINPPRNDLSVFTLLFAAPKKRVSLHRRKMRRLTKWLRPKTHISVCHYCDRGLLPHQVLPCCFQYRAWHEAGNTGTPPSLQKVGTRERKRNQELKRYEKHKEEIAKKKFVYPKEEEEEAEETKDSK